MIRHIPLRPSRAVSGRTATQQRHSLAHIAIPDLSPPAIDRRLCAPMGEALRCRYRYVKLPRFRRVVLDLGDYGSVVTASIAAS